MPNQGRLAVIAGGIGGIGSAVGKSLYDQNISLALLYAPFEATNVDSVLNEVYGPGEHPKIKTYQCDITDPASVQQAFDKISKDGIGSPTILINSAGYVNLTPLEETTPEDSLRHYMINLFGPTLTGQAFARAYIAAKEKEPEGPGGRIVNLASQAAHVALDKHGAYCASKAGLIGLTKCQANEWGRYGITANTVSPGPVWTALGQKAWGDDAVRAEYLKGVPTGELAQPEEVAAIVSFFCQESSKNITGADMRLDGGYTAR